MTSDNNLSNLCRICLLNEATNPIFPEHEENSISTKLFLCFNRKIEDIVGYPRCICDACNIRLEDLCAFIQQYNITQELLENGGNVVKSELDNNSENDASNAFTENEINTQEQELIENIDNTEVKVKNVSTVQRKRKKKPLSIKQKKTKEASKSDKTISNPERLCDICGQIFKSQYKLAIHKKKVHFKKQFQCPLCPKVCPSQLCLNLHNMRKHEATRNFICASCGKSFASKIDLSSHIGRIHVLKKPKKRFSCKFCDKTYSCAKSVLIHERSIHTGERPAECLVCGNKFYHEEYLKEHMRLHTGDTPFKCPICGKGYAQRCNMKSHLRIHKVSELDDKIISQMKPNYLKRLKKA